MRLNLTINGVLVGSANLNASRSKDEFYLRAIKTLLLQQNQEILMLITGKPVFDIEVPAAYASLLFAQKEALLRLLSDTN